MNTHDSYLSYLKREREREHDVVRCSLTTHHADIKIIVESPEYFKARAEKEEELKRLKLLSDSVTQTVLDPTRWAMIPFYDSLRVSKSGKVIQIVLNEKGVVTGIIPKRIVFNQLTKQLEVNLNTTNDEINIYSVQELMAIAWMDHERNPRIRVILKDGNPINTVVENIGFEEIEDPEENQPV